MLRGGFFATGVSPKPPSRSIRLWIRSFSSEKISKDDNSHNSLTKRRRVSVVENLNLLKDIPLEDVRNFCFSGHIDVGKSSLASRVLELTGNSGVDAQLIAWEAAYGSPATFDASSSTTATAPNIVYNNQKERIELLDTLAVEQERGITVKASAAAMLYSHPSAIGPEGVILLNMVDTPGHVDFGREVSRSLSFVQGAVMLVDATQGIQAQTWSVFEKVKSLPHPPELLVALTKVDLDSARPDHVALVVSEWLDWDDPETILYTSARNRIGISTVLDAVCRLVPPPTPLDDDDGRSLRAQVVDSWYDSRGVNCLVQVVSGVMAEGDRIIIANNKSNSSGDEKATPSLAAYSVQEVGLMLPRGLRTGELRRGQMGYVRFGLRDPRQAQPGTLLVWQKDASKKMILPKFEKVIETKSVIYASVHPEEEDGFDELCDAVERLALNDTGLEVSKTSFTGSSGDDSGGVFLGPGLRVGFQGLLHMEVFRQRLQDEFGLEAITTPPKVPYKVTFYPSKTGRQDEPYTKIIEDLSEWPEAGTRFNVQEPVVNVRIVAPMMHAGPIMELVTKKRGTEIETRPMDEETWLYTSRMPWAEVVVDFHDQIKNATAGYGSLDTSESDPPFEDADLCKVELLLNNELVAPLAFVCHKDSAQAEGRVVCQKLQAVLPRQQFVTVIQAKAEGKIIASERIKAVRKDVLTKSGKTVGGGDISRKMKLLKKQKEGKKRQQHTGKVSLSQEAFNSVITRNS